MITVLDYLDFKTILDKKIVTDDEFYYNLLKNIIKNPERYIGIFRISSIKTKLIQNVTQSHKIKFGDFMENIITLYIELMGYENLNKNMGVNDEGDYLSADQLFKKDDTIYLIEQKVRDDHDSSKKRGQYENFQKKYVFLKKKYPDYIINASMWFIDKNFSKNKKYYSKRVEDENIDAVEINVFYGEKLFVDLFKREDVWSEICKHLLRNKEERSNQELFIPDFNNSYEINNALLKLKQNEPSLYKKLLSNNDKYIELRKELFPTNPIVLNDISKK